LITEERIKINLILVKKVRLVPAQHTKLTGRVNGKDIISPKIRVTQDIIITIAPLLQEKGAAVHQKATNQSVKKEAAILPLAAQGKAIRLPGTIHRPEAVVVAIPARLEAAAIPIPLLRGVVQVPEVQEAVLVHPEAQEEDKEEE
jgi:hypothetical protein